MDDDEWDGGDTAGGVESDLSRATLAGRNWRQMDHLKGKEVFVGVDEAGRGPVLGPMVYSAFFCLTGSEQRLKDLRVDDSKKLTEADRERIFGEFHTDDMQHHHCGWLVRPLWPQYLSAKQLSKTCHMNLNELSKGTVMDMLQEALDAGLEIKHVYVDTVGHAVAYQKQLTARFPSLHGNITVTDKADSKYVVVGAASIAAKVSRDLLLRHWVPEEPSKRDGDGEYGSGYPGDSTTKQWLQDNYHPVFGFPSLARFSWGTVQKLLEDNNGPALEWCDDQDDEDPSQTHMTQFLISAPQDKKNTSQTKKGPKRGPRGGGEVMKRSGFFTARHMSIVTDSEW
ncbi:unnamed protein product [Vitrella brassicaformis CCMP3155]|uniref:Ribonuclease n=2 Tax=Vitrella brassicaformis TaxID=1169539 RepID=A0A0G4H2W6_VITBC|nr:unnamed protein product [Vitrella brassicaformis CCMP3155]|eukprot:CEM38014.1 unnamed protein product [Vitrella brassicaformis CCMP3155]